LTITHHKSPVYPHITNTTLFRSPDCQLGHVEAERSENPRFWHDLQGLSARDHPAASFIWRVAPLYSCAGLLVRRLDLRDSHQKYCPAQGQLSLRNFTDLPRLL